MESAVGWPWIVTPPSFVLLGGVGEISSKSAAPASSDPTAAAVSPLPTMVYALRLVYPSQRQQQADCDSLCRR
jgi:hypothetical protein